MLTMSADLWELHAEGYCGVIPVSPNPRNPWIASEVAKQALERFPNLFWDYELVLQRGKAFPFYVVEQHNLLLFPIRSTDGTAPDLRTIRNGLSQLNLFPKEEFVLPYLGHGLKGYGFRELYNLLNSYLDDRFVLVDLLEERLPWKGKEGCLKCGFRVDNWSSRHRVCKRCVSSHRGKQQIQRLNHRQGGLNTNY